MKLEKLFSKNPTANPFTKTTLFSDKNVLVFEINLKSSEEFPPCEHKGSSLLLYAVAGKGKIEMNDNETEFEQGDLMCFCEEEIFKIKNHSAQDLYCFAAITPRPPIKEQYNELGI
jgi:mannose-6-phosphate isomerase-like protein (cupin superfamily)